MPCFWKSVKKKKIFYFKDIIKEPFDSPWYLFDDIIHSLLMKFIF